MSNIAIRVQGVGKQYRIGGTQEKYKTLRDSLAGTVHELTSVFQRKGIHKPKYEDIWALKDVSFEVKRGEVIGIIGRNGAGKSTLLKILSRITEPTEGIVDIYGRVGSLLEVGTGFHPELTGRENIYLNGAILGMKRVEIERKFDEIVAFAEVEKFIDTAVKHYSSGMYLRLAFAVAAHLEPEILLVDEVLAVGDATFQKKCLGKMGEVAHEGRTVLFVSHTMAAITHLCPQSILLADGHLAVNDRTSEVIATYLRSSYSLKTTGNQYTSEHTRRSGNRKGLIEQVEILGPNEKHATTLGIGEPFSVKLHFRVFTYTSIVVGVELKSAEGLSLLNLRSDSQGLFFGPYESGALILLQIQVPGLPLYPGSYFLEPWIGEKKGARIDHIHDDIHIDIEAVGNFQSESLIQPGRGLILVDCFWKDKVVH